MGRATATTSRFGRPTWEPIRAIGYVRVSTEEQARHGFGLEMQRSAIREYCDGEGIELVGIASDEGISGTLGLDARPGLAQAVAATATGDASVVVVRSIDRIGRDPWVYFDAKRRIQAHGASLVSVTQLEATADSDVGELLETILVGVGRMERKEIVRKMSIGRLKKASSGGYAGGRIPLGYRLVRDNDGTRWVVVEQGAEIVRRIFRLRASGMTYRAIAAELTAEGITTPYGRSTWSAEAVHTIVGNIAYLGRRSWTERKETVVSEQAFEPIVDDETWTACHPDGMPSSKAARPKRDARHSRPRAKVTA